MVPANPKEWEVPPFSGTVKDGKIWGRGAIDDKGPGVIELMAMLAIKRAGILLNRDVLFVATGDEEEGGKNGAGWFVDHEGQRLLRRRLPAQRRRRDSARCPTSARSTWSPSPRKRRCGCKLTASGPAGHASDPPAETAVTRLVRALEKLSEYKTPMHVIGPVQDYYHSIAELDHGPKQQLDLAAALKDPELSEKVSLRSEPERARPRYDHAHRAVRQPEDQRDLRNGLRRNRLPAAAEQRSQEGHQATSRKRSATTRSRST